MKWRTEVKVPEGRPKIGYSDTVLTLGSCFADHLGGKLSYYHFRHLGNPFGVIFHPAPFLDLLKRAANANSFSDKDLFNHRNRWGTLQAHSSLSASTSEEATRALNQGLEALRKGLEHSSHLVMTLGTAYGYHHAESGVVVANCHKLPADNFRRQLTPVRSLVDCLEEICRLASEINKNLTCLFTVSPVRHIRDGLVENQRSKAHLITAVHEVVDNGLAHYFPAYELLMDELRDYRFYDRDLIHPSAAAVDYVWEHFEQAWIDPEARAVMGEVAAIRKGLAHRPLHGETLEYKGFRESLQAKITRLQKQFPHMAF